MATSTGQRVQTTRPLIRLLLAHQAEPITVEWAADKLKRTPEQVRTAMRRLAGNYGVRWTREGYEMVAEPTQQDLDSMKRDERDEAAYQKHVASNRPEVENGFHAQIVHETKRGELVLESADGETWMARKI